MSFRLLTNFEISGHTDFFSVKISAPKNQIPHPFSFLISLLNLRLFGLVLLGSQVFRRVVGFDSLQLKTGLVLGQV